MGEDGQAARRRNAQQVSGHGFWRRGKGKSERESERERERASEMDQPAPPSALHTRNEVDA